MEQTARMTSHSGWLEINVLSLNSDGAPQIGTRQGISLFIFRRSIVLHYDKVLPSGKPSPSARFSPGSGNFRP